jgi:spermidine/putrescine ABC transporter ATP-binding subunit
MQSNRPGKGVSLEIEALSKVYDHTTVVDQVSFRVEAGQLLTLLGPSGSGKTTILRMIAGFTPLTSGEIRIGDQLVGGIPPHKRNIGVVFQHYALFPHLTVFQNVAYPLEMRKLAKSDIRERVARALTLVRLEGFEKRYPKQLSGGQQQRVALARAIVFEPAVLLMDEPLGALDKRLREAMQNELRELQKTLGITTISVTHDQIEALVMSDSIVVLENGRLQQQGRPGEVYRRPCSRFVADFIGESNFFDGMLMPGDDGRVCFHANGQLVIEVQVDSSVQAQARRPVCAAIRPERIKIGEAARQCDNRFPGTIQRVAYLGDVLRYQIVLAGGETVVCKLLAPDHRDQYQPGTNIEVGWQSADCLIVK